MSLIRLYSFLCACVIIFIVIGATHKMGILNLSASKLIDNYDTKTGQLTPSSIKALQGPAYNNDANPQTEPISYGIETGVPYQPPQLPVAPSAAVVDPLLQSLGSLDTIKANKLAAAKAAYDKAIAGYDEADAADRRTYEDQTNRNEDTFAGNTQAALLNAIRGGSGLKSVVGSLGALGGSALDLIRRAIGQAANEDAGAAEGAFETNAGNLTTGFGEAEREQRARRGEAKDNLYNSQQNAKADVLNSRQGIFQQLADLYGAGTAEGDQYASQAGALAPQIAATTKASVSPYAKASSLYSPAALQEYLAGTKNLTVSTANPSDTPINSPLYNNDKRKDQLSGVA